MKKMNKLGTLAMAGAIAFGAVGVVDLAQPTKVGATMMYSAVDINQDKSTYIWGTDRNVVTTIVNSDVTFGYITSIKPQRLINGVWTDLPELLDGTVGPKAAAVNHTVVSGDSLWSISQKYGVPVDEIKALNGLTSDNIYVGQVLKIKLASGSKTINSGISSTGVFKAKGTYRMQYATNMGENYEGQSMTDVKYSPTFYIN